MRAVDENWPEPGARIFHSVGVWPALIDDETEVTEWNAPHRAAFIARGWPIGEARIIIEVRPHREGCVVRMHEYAVRGALQYVPRVLTDPLLDFRNREALHRLGYLAEGQWVNDETEERSTPKSAATTSGRTTAQSSSSVSPGCSTVTCPPCDSTTCVMRALAMALPASEFTRSCVGNA